MPFVLAYGICEIESFGGAQSYTPYTNVQCSLHDTILLGETDHHSGRLCASYWVALDIYEVAHGNILLGG